MTPDELQRVLDNHTVRQRGNSALYFIALVIAGVLALIVYGDW